MSDDEKFEQFLQREVKDFKTAEPVAADEMWSRIEGDVAEAIQPRTLTYSPRRGWLAVSAAIAATLVLGVFIGRTTTDNRKKDASVVASAPRYTADDSIRIAEHARAATLSHLADAEMFLTEVRADLRSQRPDSQLSERSRELLARTRLLLGARGERPPQVDALLEDLELLLAEISALPDSRRTMDVKLIEETMRQGNILPRIRTTLPAPSAGT